MSTGNIPLTPFVDDELITKELLNGEFANLQTLTAPEGIEGYEDTDAEMQIQTNPYPGSVTSHASSLAGEIERLRYQIAQIINAGVDYWYNKPASDIGTMQNSLVPIGGVIEWAAGTSNIPTNFRSCSGQAISRTTYATLFSIIGDAFGVGDGVTTFNIPDCRDRMSIGPGNLYAVAATGGEATHVLTTPEIPAHLHTVNITDPGHTHTVSDPQHSHGVTDPGHVHAEKWITGSGATSGPSGGNAQNAAQTQGTVNTASAITGLTTNNASTGVTNNSNTTGITAASTNTGGGGAHNNLPPYIGIYKIIRVI